MEREKRKSKIIAEPKLTHEANGKRAKS